MVPAVPAGLVRLLHEWLISADICKCFVKEQKGTLPFAGAGEASPGRQAPALSSSNTRGQETRLGILRHPSVLEQSQVTLSPHAWSLYMQTLESRANAVAG